MLGIIDPSYLTAEEVRFLRQHNIELNVVADARRYAATGWDQAAREIGVHFAVGVECKRGHRLRVRSGHCIVCKPASIKYALSHRKPGFVYIASTKSGRLHKVGSAVDVDDRQSRLRRDVYAGQSDWTIIAWFYCAEAQKQEMSIQSKLQEYAVDASYLKSTGKVAAREIFGPDLRPIWLEFCAALESAKAKKSWRHTKITDFDFARLGGQNSRSV